MTSFNRMLAVFLPLALALSSAPAASQSHNEGYDHVVKVQANRDNHLYIAVAGNFSTDHGCSQPWWARSEQSLDKAQTTAMLQISLSSLLSATSVRGGGGHGSHEGEQGERAAQRHESSGCRFGKRGQQV